MMKNRATTLCLAYCMAAVLTACGQEQQSPTDTPMPEGYTPSPLANQNMPPAWIPITRENAPDAYVQVGQSGLDDANRNAAAAIRYAASQARCDRVDMLTFGYTRSRPGFIFYRADCANGEFVEIAPYSYR